MIIPAFNALCLGRVGDIFASSLSPTSCKHLSLRNLNTCFLSLEAVFQTVGFLGDNDTIQEISAWFFSRWGWLRQLVFQDFLKLFENNRASRIPATPALEAERVWAVAA